MVNLISAVRAIEDVLRLALVVPDDTTAYTCTSQTQNALILLYSCWKIVHKQRDVKITLVHVQKLASKLGNKVLILYSGAEL